jgi:hypothetical protein
VLGLGQRAGEPLQHVNVGVGDHLLEPSFGLQQIGDVPFFEGGIDMKAPVAANRIRMQAEEGSQRLPAATLCQGQLDPHALGMQTHLTPTVRSGLTSWWAASGHLGS